MFLKEGFENVNFEKSQPTTYHDKSPSMKKDKIHILIMHFNLCILCSPLSADFLKCSLPILEFGLFCHNHRKVTKCEESIVAQW